MHNTEHRARLAAIRQRLKSVLWSLEAAPLLSSAAAEAVVELQQSGRDIQCLASDLVAAQRAEAETLRKGN